MTFLKKIRGGITDLFEWYVVPVGHEKCTNCDGMGTDDGFVKCNYCEGYGNIPVGKKINKKK